MKKITGGPAFPGHSSVAGGANSGMYGGGYVASQGMTLRDYLAAKAMHGYISTAGGPCIIGGLGGAEDELAKQSYKMADAMLRAREAS